MAGYLTIEMREYRYSLKRAIFLNKWATSRIVLQKVFVILDLRDIESAEDIPDKQTLVKSIWQKQWIICMLKLKQLVIKVCKATECEEKR